MIILFLVIVIDKETKMQNQYFKPHSIGLKFFCFSKSLFHWDFDTVLMVLKTKITFYLFNVKISRLRRSISRSIDRLIEKESISTAAIGWEMILPMQSGFRIPCGGVFIGIRTRIVRIKIFFKIGFVDQILDVFMKLKWHWC